MKKAFHPVLVAFAASGLLVTADPRCDTRGEPVVDRTEAIRRSLGDEEALGVIRMPFDSPELVDPRSALPDVAAYPLTDLAALYRYSRGCATADLREVRDPALKKARDWHRFLCGAADLPPRFFDDEPRFHPGGSSYVALAALSGLPRFGTRWLRDHANRLHVMESEILLDAGLALSDERRALYRLAPETLRRLVDREPLVVGDERVFLLDTAHGPAGTGAYELYARKRYDAISRASRPPDRRVALWSAVGVATVLLGMALVQTFRRVRFRRLLMQERARVLRTLAHEVRTPVASLKLVLEELRSDYDDLPPLTQKGFLAVCDEVHRLERVIRESSRYLGASRDNPGQAYRRVPIESVNAFVTGVLEPYRDRLTFEPLDADPGLVTDPYWFAVCIRNLVDNALTHGAPPVTVRLHTDRRRLHLTVSDGGAAEIGELQRGLRPFLRTNASPGFGLGLAIVADTVSGLRGKLTWGTRPTRFTMSIKRSA